MMKLKKQYWDISRLEMNCCVKSVASKTLQLKVILPYFCILAALLPSHAFFADWSNASPITGSLPQLGGLGSTQVDRQKISHYDHHGLFLWMMA